MEESVSNTESADSKCLSEHELLILHTAEAQEWATYLQQILKSSLKFRKRSILLYALGPAHQLDGYDFDNFQSCKCIVLLLTEAFLDMLYEPNLQGALHTLLFPPHRVVALLCGIAEDDVPTEIFNGWQSWRKVCADDEPAIYLTTILESIADSKRLKAEHDSKVAPELHVLAPTENPTNDKTEEVVTELQKQTVQNDEDPVSTWNSASEESSHLTCLTVQPNKVLCGEQETLFIIFKQKIDHQLIPEVEFSSESGTTKRFPGTVENEYTLSVAAPDMPAGVVSLTMYTDRSCVSLKPVRYYTSMVEVSRLIENATDPVNFICQAFNFTSNMTESVDNTLTDSFKSRMPETGLHLFGIRQLEENNMGAYQRDVELPTLLHFAAKYGLKKLTTILLRCPGALQAYSVMNKYGDYPNKLAEKSGFLDLRQYMDEFVETADMLRSHFEDTENSEEVYELMSTASQDIMMKYSGCSEDIYESMLAMNPECAEDLYEVMNAVDENPEEALLRTFFKAKPHCSQIQDNSEQQKGQEEEKDEEEEEDPYNIFLEDIYDIVDTNSTYTPGIQNRPPAPIPRHEGGPDPEPEPEPKTTLTYISRVFSEKSTSQHATMATGYPAVRPVVDIPASVHDPYAGMKTPGQRQLISLQERVKVGEITVNEAVQEFKAWQFDHEGRAHSIRYQQENLKKLRDSITRRHKEREKTGKELDYEISAPLQRNSSATFECAVYESGPRVVAQPPPVTHPIQRGAWKTGSTSSTSSTESNRLSTHSAFSCSSGTEPDLEDTLENVPPLPPPPRHLRQSDATAIIPPPRIPPRIPDRVPDKALHERYIAFPTRALPQIPSNRPSGSAPPPPVPRRLR
ncbi:phosphoinositide 3-kinase adapter protein 1 isoform X1 [Solea solea]|uniref:phosphoinositide 3-kinase adapter protein 1 isoform X1 n=2 Tax=Solea solea TaxID=90069 RepID=UPI00272A0AB9|nr:phosphoinositide 3-kinase adapter protein 1 isoform X1 [Solea solea]